MKACTVCRGVSDDFSPDKRASDGLQSRCRPCGKAAHHARYHSDPAAARKRQLDYYQRNTEAVLAINARSRAKHIDKVRADKKAYYERVKTKPAYVAKIAEYTAATKDRKREYDRGYRARRPEAYASERARAWAAANPEKRKAIAHQYKAKRRSQEEGGISGGVLAAWTLEQPKVCFYCDVDCAGNYHIDHFMPLARGGAHVLTNLRIACPTCNLRKNAKDPAEWIESLAA